jgi:hypothetical protein
MQEILKIDVLLNQESFLNLTSGSFIITYVPDWGKLQFSISVNGELSFTSMDCFAFNLEENAAVKVSWKKFTRGNSTHLFHGSAIPYLETLLHGILQVEVCIATMSREIKWNKLVFLNVIH